MNSALYSQLLSLSTTKRTELREELAARIDLEARQRRIDGLFPDDGEFRRELYAKHTEFFRLGATSQERCFMAANRVGKTIVGAYECALHLTGGYPSWWIGRRFDEPVDIWAASDSSQTTRDIVQLELVGPPHDRGTGMIPGRAILDVSPARGIPDAIDTLRVQHVSGGQSRLGFKSFDQGREKFQGTKKHCIWLDEEPPASVYDECMIRLMTLNGLMLCTFTPLKGLSEIALRYLPHLAPAPEIEVRAW